MFHDYLATAVIYLWQLVIGASKEKQLTKVDPI